ncbi:MAG: zinc-ribbon domain-containing protein [Nitrosopumilus sp. B06]|nr:MAG: zinc-ribbon domain-containing protein [Nitrosopumilus sp. D6]RNJ79660.1 MAG: zinc-ribbon domain-containing protein [Nitrosopumilus sp. B06]
MSFGEVDTLNMLYEKLQSLFEESQGYYETFLDTNNMYKKGQLSDKEFFAKLGDYTVAYSALEFLAIKVLFEMKKSMGNTTSATQSPGLMPGMGTPGMAGVQPGMPQRGTAANPVGGPPGIVSAQESFGDVGTLPSPDPSLVPKQAHGCSTCGAQLRSNAKFCTSCGAKT